MTHSLLVYWKFFNLDINLVLIRVEHWERSVKSTWIAFRAFYAFRLFKCGDHRYHYYDPGQYLFRFLYWSEADNKFAFFVDFIFEQFQQF